MTTDPRDGAVVGPAARLSAVLPVGVRAVECLGDLTEPLFPAEERVIARAVDQRRREFRTVRGCAAEALAQFGLPRPPLLPGRRGDVTWPPGLTGSMTHCTGYRAAAVARLADVAALGIDAEPHDVLPAGVLDLVARPEERGLLTELARDRPQVCWDRLLFSAKESVFKAWYPVMRRELDFDRAGVVLDAAGRFTARLVGEVLELPGRRLGTLSGRWRVVDGVLLTAVAVPGGAVDGLLYLERH